MVLKKDAVLSVLKSTDATMKAAEFSLISPKKPEEDDGDLVFSGPKGDVTLKAEGITLSVICKRLGDQEKTVAQILFDIENEDWNSKDTKSVANEIADSVSSYFGTPLIYDTQEKKSDKKAEQKGSVDTEREEAIAKKKSKKDSVVTYEAVNLANRLENIYPEIKGSLDKNTELFEVFLAEEYFETVATPLILESIRQADRQTMKKLFNAFNIFYEEGPKDVQSLIAVSILGMNFAEEQQLYDNCVEFMDADLKDAVDPIIKYLRSASGKKRIHEFHNPKPYKESKK